MDPRFGLIPGGKYKIVEMPMDRFVDLLSGSEEKPGLRIIEDWLPPGSKCVRSVVDYVFYKLMIFLVIENESFDFVPPGTPLPILKPKVQKIINLPGTVKQSRKKKVDDITYEPEPEDDIEDETIE